MKSDVVTLTIDMRFPAESIEQAIPLLASVCGRIEAKAGCLESMVARDSIQETRVRYTETWASEETFLRHLRSEEFRRVLLAMDMCSEEPGVSIGNFTGHSGLQYLQQLCDRQGAGEVEE